MMKASPNGVHCDVKRRRTMLVLLLVPDFSHEHEQKENGMWNSWIQKRDNASEPQNDQIVFGVELA